MLNRFVIFVAVIVVSMALSPFTSGQEDISAEPRLSATNVMRFLDEKLPEFAAELRKIKREDPGEYYEALQQARDNADEFHSIRRELGTPIAESFLQVLRLDREVDQFVERYQDAETDSARDQIRNELRNVMRQLFDLRLRIDGAELMQLREEAAEFEADLRRRTNDRERSVEEQLREALEDDENESDFDEDDDRSRWLPRIKRRKAEHIEQLSELRELKDSAEQAGDTDLFGEASEIIGLHENALALHEQFQVALEAEGEEINAERIFGRLRFAEDFLELRREILDLTKQERAARRIGDHDIVSLLRADITKLRIRAGLEDLDGPAADAKLAGPLEITPDDISRAAQADFDRQITPLLQDHCIDCHGPDVQEAEINFVVEAANQPLVRRGELWNKVVAHLKNRVMPPEDAGKMDDNERRLLAAYLEWAVRHFDYSRIDEPGYEGGRRLTHTEYNNCIRDLFGIDLRPADKFPAELSGTSGFDNSSNTLFLHRLLMERYFGAAEEVVESALSRLSKTQAQRQSRATIFVAEPEHESSELDAANKILTKFLLRAYRRPPTEREIADSMRHFNIARSTGNDFHEAIKGVIQFVLVSPQFLLRIEQPQSNDRPYRVSDWDLASRLSFFLWSSMPDDRLLDAASLGNLREVSVLRAHVDRMLSDPRSKTLGTVFAAQWLGSQHLGVRIRPDPIDNPWCTDSLMESLKAETAMFFHSLIIDDQPIARLIDADYTYLNEEVAAHYGIEGVEGPQMRRVSISDGNRGGIFGQGSLLAITSFPARTSPVVRGKWILSEVLGTPPPPPPPNVSEFSDEIADNRFLSPRRKLQLHRRNPNCYSCHSQIDPLGLSLESFDWFGRWRSEVRGRPVDSRGKLPNGTEFSGPDGLKKVIIEQRMDDLVRQISQKMLSYALGRQLEYYDEPAVRQIVRITTDNGYRFRSLIQAVVESYPFQFKKNPPDTAGS